MKALRFLLIIVCAYFLASCVSTKQADSNSNLDRARQTLDSLYLNYSVSNSHLLRENYPFNEQYKVTYLASENQTNMPNQFSYLWPYSGTFSAVNSLLEATHDKKYQQLLEKQVLPGLEEYFDTERTPIAYSSYIRTAPTSDRFYDDNIWVGIDFIDIYQITKEKKYLDKAQLIWNFIESGTDSLLGDGIYFKRGKELYKWTQKNLQDSTDYLYFDNIRLDGKIGKAKFAYNSGQMMQSAALLYQLTKNPDYLKDAQSIAKECYNYFFTDFTTDTGESLKMLKQGNIWFTAVMLRGFIELYQLDQNKTFIDAFNQCLSYAWDNARDENGLFSTDLTGNNNNEKKWLLTQAAMVEMYSRLAAIQ